MAGHKEETMPQWTCTKGVINGGVCVSHGAKAQKCSNRECTNGAVKVVSCMGSSGWSLCQAWWLQRCERLQLRVL